MSTEGGFYFGKKSPDGRLEIDQTFMLVSISGARFKRLSGVVGFLSVESAIPKDAMERYRGKWFSVSKISAVEEYWDEYGTRYVSRGEKELQEGS